MKKILLLATLMIGFTTFSQYEDELKMLHTACMTDEVNIDSLFSSDKYDNVPNDSLYVYEDVLKGSFYVIEYSDGLIANYVEDYNKVQLKKMNKAIRAICGSPTRFEGSTFYSNNEYYYMVSDFKKQDNTILITVTKNH
jgi:hypothetical protein